jgi:hypothetical protein
MTSSHPDNRLGNASTSEEDAGTVVIGPDGMPTTPAPPDDDDPGGERNITELVEQPAKVMRIGGMIRQLLEEVKSAPLDEASRTRLASVYESSIKELEVGLAPELVDELERLSLPFSSETPSEAELRIAQAQLVGWLEGLFHGIQTAIYAQQVSARAQFEQMRRALPPGARGPGSPQGQGGQHPGVPGQQAPDEPGAQGGMYL